MPEISRFFGIVITMYQGDHGPTHFHARRGEHRARIAISDCEVLAGSLPPRALGMVVEWATSRRVELEPTGASQARACLSTGSSRFA